MEKSSENFIKNSVGSFKIILNQKGVDSKNVKFQVKCSIGIYSTVRRDQVFNQVKVVGDSNFSVQFNKP